jgi:hypothetical protein
MSISRVASATASTTSLTMPSGRQIGDLEVMFAYNSGAATVPTVPAGWLTLKSGSGSTNAGVVAFRFCTNASDTSGTWTNATRLICVVYRGALAVGVSTAGAVASSTSINYPASTLVAGDGQSWFLGFAGHRTATNVNTAPSGMTNVTSVGTGPMAAAHDTNAVDASNWASTNVTVSASSGHVSFVVEIMDFSAWDPYDANAAQTFSNHDLTTTTGSAPATSDNVRSSFPRASGKYVFGINLGTATVGIGVGNASSALSGFSSADSMAFFNFSGAANWELQGAGLNTLGDGTLLPTSTQGWVAVDTTGHLAWIKFSGGHWNNDASANPDTGAGGISFSGLSGPYFPVFSGAASADNAVYSGTDTGHGLTTFQVWDSLGATTSIVSDWAAAIEFAASVQADAPGRVEFSAVLAVDRAAALEFAAGLRADAASAAELAGGARVDGAAPIETRANLFADASIMATLLATLARDGSSPIETAATEQASLPAPVEFGAGLAVDRAATVETAAGLARDAGDPFEFSGTPALIVLSDAGARIEWSTSLAVDGGTRVDEAASLSVDRPAGQETAADVASTGLAAVEFARDIFGDAQAALAFLASVQRDTPAKQANSATIIADARALVEWLGTATFRKLVVFMRGRAR